MPLDLSVMKFRWGAPSSLVTIKNIIYMLAENINKKLRRDYLGGAKLYHQRATFNYTSYVWSTVIVVKFTTTKRIHASLMLVTNKLGIFPLFPGQLKSSDNVGLLDGLSVETLEFDDGLLVPFKRMKLPQPVVTMTVQLVSHRCRQKQLLMSLLPTCMPTDIREDTCMSRDEFMSDNEPMRGERRDSWTDKGPGEIICKEGL